MQHSLNHVFRLVWNHRLGTWCVAPEIARGKGKTKNSTRGQTPAARQLWPLVLLLGSATAWAELPQGGQVSAGQGQLNYQGNTLQVQQHSDKLALDWQSFSIGKDNQVVFNQPDAQSVALNRVLGSDVSRIQGAIKANGQVFLLNPNGVLFSPTAQVNTGGLVAATLELSNDDFMAGNFQFEGDSTAAVTNQGEINVAEGGTIALIAATIVNEGSLQATAGNVLMGAGRKVTLDMGGPVKLRVDEGVLNTLIEQGGAIRADGGKVLLTARAAGELATSVINHTGITQAQTLSTGENGEIVLLGDMQQGQLQVAGTLDASAPAVEGKGGDGGFIETSAAKVQIKDSVQVTTLAENGNTGEWLIDPTDFYITAGSAASTDSGIGASTLSAQLAGSDITIETVDAGSEAGDIYVNAPVSWNADTTLSLNADNYIYINKAITATGTNAGLVLNTGAGKNYVIAQDASITLSGSNAALNINGTDYTLIHDMAALDAIDTTGLGGAYALAKDLDASGTTYDRALVAEVTTEKFTGTFTGLGHTITGLTIYNAAPTTYFWGLFGYNQHGTIRDVGLLGGSVTVESIDEAGFTLGMLVGTNNGSIYNAYATGNVSLKIGTDSRYVDISAGGLVGLNWSTLNNTYATGNVSLTGSARSAYAGGLVGISKGNTLITNSYATGAVTASALEAAYAGGLVGSTTSKVSKVYATGDVSATASDKYAAKAGGLLGASGISITDAYATGNASAIASGEANAHSGGLVGFNDADITNSYSTGTASASSSGTGTVNTGGLVGQNDGEITDSYWDTTTSGMATGVGSGSSSGAAGLTTSQLQDTNGFMTNASGWDFDTTWAPSSSGYYPQLYALSPVLYVNVPNITMTYGDNLASQSLTPISGGPDRYVFGPKGDTVYTRSNAGSYTIPATTTSDGGVSYRVVGSGGTLTINPRAISIAGDNQSRIYGNANPALTYKVTSGSLVNGDNLSGTLATSASTSSDVGGYDITQGSLTASDNYTLSYTPATLTVNPRTINVTADNQRQTYGGVSPSLTYQITSGSLASGDSLSGSITTTATSSSDAGTYNITQGSLAASDNYSLSYIPGTLTIDPRPITVTGDSQYRFYGDDNAALTYKITTGSLIDGDSLSGNLTTVATPTSDVGNYDITQGSLDNSNYAITYRPGKITVNRASLLVTANDAAKTYDGAAYTGGNGVTYRGFVNGETEAVLGGTLTYSGSAQGAVDAGDYTLSVSGLSAGNYMIFYTDGALSIDKAPLTVTAQDASKIYDGLAYTGGNGVTYSGFVAGEDASILDGALAYGGNAQGAVNAGDYTLSVSGLSADNYAINYVDGTLTIGKGVVDLLISAQDAFKVYDGEAWFGGNGIDIEGLAAGETLADLEGTLVWGGTAQGAINAGDYTITASGLSSPNYDIHFNHGTLTIGKAPLTIAAQDASKTYDGLAYTGGNGVTYSGFVAGENAGVLSGTLAYDGSAQGAINAGDYTLSASGLSADNYDINYVDGTLSIAQAPLTVTARNASKTYDGLAWSGNNGVSYDGFVNGETTSVLNGTLSWGGTAEGAINAGDYTLTVSGLTSNNYAINYMDGTLTIGKEVIDLIISAKDAFKEYDGEAWFGGNGIDIEGLAAGETLADLEGTLVWGGSAQGAINAGDYTITASGLSSPNYDIRFNNGTLTIGKANLTVAAQNASKTYDGLAYTGGNGVTYSGFVAGEDASILDGTLAYNGSAQGAINTGNYTLSASGLSSDNYDINYVDGTLTIDKANLTATVQDALWVQDGSSWSGGNGILYEGFVNGEDTSVLQGDLLWGGSAQGAEMPGDYTLSASGLSADNYQLTFVDGQLRIISPIEVAVQPYRNAVQHASLPIAVYLQTPINLAMSRLFKLEGSVIKLPEF